MKIILYYKFKHNLYKCLTKIFSDKKGKILGKSKKYYDKLYPKRKINYSYIAHYEDSQDFSGHKTDIKTFAYYLPQFHVIKENNIWWGDNFTEWTNTTKSKPRFKNHYQPRTPHADIGYYDLANPDTIRQQAALAKAHGITGFCLYHYWFSGKKLLETPVDLILANQDIELTFCLCWANENWTRRWDGEDEEILIKQEYLDDDPLNFIKDLIPYLQDRRYFKKDGKPVILVYNILDIPDPEKTFKVWREFCHNNGVGDIEIWGVRAFIPAMDFSFGALVDREVEFPPHRFTDKLKIIKKRDKIFPDNVYDLESALESFNVSTTLSDYPVVRAAMLGWDNSARKKKDASIYSKFSLYLYFKWLRGLIDYTRKNFAENDRYLFINAWNEWAEGTYLEPDEKYGYASINTTSRAIFGLPFEPAVEENAVLIVMLESMGDIIACEPIVRYLDKLYQGRPLYWVTAAHYTELVRYNPYLKGVVPIYDMDQWMYYKAALPKSVKIVDLHFRERNYILAGGQLYINENDGQITSFNYYNMGGSLLEIMSKTAGLEAIKIAPIFYRRPAKFIHDVANPYIVFHAVAFEANRGWQQKKWIKLAHILARQGYKIVEVGLEPTLPLDLPNYINKTNLPSVHDSADIIADASCFIGIDSSMAHIANALNVPGIILLGKYRDFERYMPYSGNYQNGIRSRIIYAPPGEPASVIRVQEVVAAHKDLMQEVGAC